MLSEDGPGAHGMFVVEPFDRKRHDRSHFDCGVASLNHYIKRQVSNDIRRNLARCSVAVRDAACDRVAGYYTLSAHSVEAEDLPGDAPTVPYAAVPAVLIGRLAVSREFQGNDLGKHLVVSALRKSVALHEQLGIQLIVVDPLGEDVARFYEKFGFRELSNSRLFLPIKTAKAAYELARAQRHGTVQDG